METPRRTSPWLWLVYMPLLFVPWLWFRPTSTQALGTAAALALFIPIYLAAMAKGGRALAAGAVASMIISFVVAFAATNWTVISIYAATMAARISPRRHAVVAVSACLVATAGYGLARGDYWIFWLPGVLMMILVSMDALSTAALEQKNSALAAAQGEVRQLAVAAERERIGRDLHDLLGRTLTLIALKAELAERVGINDFERAKKEMQDIGEAAREVLAEVRSAVAGITDASLHREAEEAKRVLATAGIECILQGDFTSASPGSSAVCAMALREAVTNVVRHSGARTCTISVDENGKELRLSVVDDGQSSGLYRGGGIDGTKARLEAAGGEFSVVGGSQGTRVSVVLPRAPHS